MTSTDPISDMFTRIRNAAMVNKDQISLPYSKVKEEIAKILVASGYLKSSKIEQVDGKRLLQIEISAPNQASTITEIHRLSRPGRRVYVQSKEIPKVKRGRGIVIVSTSKGFMSGTDAASKKLGGELVCEVY